MLTAVIVKYIFKNTKYKLICWEVDTSLDFSYNMPLSDTNWCCWP